MTSLGIRKPAVFATNAYNADFAGRVAFARLSTPLHAATGDRALFIGRNGALAKPAGLEAAVLPVRFGAGLDPCAALQSAIELAPGATIRIVHLLGQGKNEDDARDLMRRHGDVEAADVALASVTAAWDRTLGAIEVHTPDVAISLPCSWQ